MVEFQLEAHNELKILTINDAVVASVINFLPYRSVRYPMGAPTTMAVIYVTDVIQEISPAVKGTGEEGDLSTVIMGESQPCTMPKLRRGMVTVGEIGTG